MHIFNGAYEQPRRENGRIPACDDGVAFVEFDMFGHFFQCGVAWVDAMPYQAAEIIGVFDFAGKPHVGIQQGDDSGSVVVHCAYDSDYAILVDHSHFGTDSVCPSFVERDEILRFRNAVVDDGGKMIFVVLCDGIRQIDGVGQKQSAIVAYLPFQVDHFHFERCIPPLQIGID